MYIKLFFQLYPYKSFNLKSFSTQLAKNDKFFNNCYSRNGCFRTYGYCNITNVSSILQRSSGIFQCTLSSFLPALAEFRINVLKNLPTFPAPFVLSTIVLYYFRLHLTQSLINRFWPALIISNFIKIIVFFTQSLINRFWPALIISHFIKIIVFFSYIKKILFFRTSYSSDPTSAF